MNLIPFPYEFTMNSGTMPIKLVSINSEFDLPLAMPYSTKGGIPIEIKKDSDLGDEEYKLDVTPTGADIVAGSKTAAYYALQSIRVMSGYDAGGRELKCCKIHDKPSYLWRGMSLDESRHFFGKEEVKRLLDQMFIMKLNRLHWHLTDDQGWRIEIKKYPLLTEIGSKRKYTNVNGWGSTDVINEPYGGFYTQDDIREIVAYAKERGITVVPEIDMPAHFAAALAAYPWLGCREIETEVPGYFGGKIPESQGIKDWNRTACLGKDTTFEFIYGVIDEVCELFDAPYFHIGGDESPRDEWKKCDKCRKVIEDNHLKNEDELQGWFNNKICKYVEKKGKHLIGWNEILTAESLDNSVIAQYWISQRDRRTERFIKNGGKIIMSKHQAFYFDMTYALYPLQNTYNYSPEKYHIDAVLAKNILGIEGEVWTEWIDARPKLDLNIFPRMQALAESAWTPQHMKDYKSFKTRLNAFKPSLDAMGIGYAVDKVAEPKGLIYRGKVQKLFNKGDTHYELKMNDLHKQKGEQ